MNLTKTDLVQQELVHPLAVVLEMFEHLALPVPLDVDSQNLYIPTFVLTDDCGCEVPHAKVEFLEVPPC